MTMNWRILLLIQTLGLVFGNIESSIFVGGWGNWTYSYEPLPLPHDCSLEHAHGISVVDSTSSKDGKNNIIITYKDANDPSKCLLKWSSSSSSSSDYNEPPEYLGPGEALCGGVPHGLTTTRESIRTSSSNGDDDEDEYVLYHANNEQALHKTTMDGRIIWSSLGPPAFSNTNKTTYAKDDTLYSPTWIAAEPSSGSPYFYLADGYGSNRIYVYYKSNGTYTGHAFGGPGTAHGQFQTCHSIYWDARIGKMAVCDRENYRLEYFDIDAHDPSLFEYSHSHTFAPFLQRLCNLRVTSSTGCSKGMGILAALEGMVGIVNAENELVSVLNITDKLGHLGFLHPHDAHFVDDDGSFVLVTWNPGRVGSFRRVQVAKDDDAIVATQR